MKLRSHYRKGCAIKNEFSTISDILEELSKLQEVVDVQKKVRRTHKVRGRTHLSFKTGSGKAQLTKALKMSDPKKRQAQLDRTLKRIKITSSGYANLTKRDIFDRETLNLMIEEMASYSIRYGYHVASDYNYSTQDIYMEVAVKYLKGLYPKERAKRALEMFNSKVSGSNLTQFTEIEILKIVSRI